MIDWISRLICKWLGLSETTIGSHGIVAGDVIIIPFLIDGNQTDPPVWYTVSSFDEKSMTIEYKELEQ